MHKIANPGAVSESYKLQTFYAHWAKSDIKYYVHVTTSPSNGVITASANTPSEGYYNTGDTCVVSSAIGDSAISRVYRWEASQVRLSGQGSFTNIESTAKPFLTSKDFEFQLGAHPEWEQPRENPDEKDIFVRIVYKNMSVPVSLECVPSDGLLGTASINSTYNIYVDGDELTVEAKPKKEDLDAEVLSIETSTNEGASWSKVDFDADSTTGDVSVGLIVKGPSFRIRVTFGQPGTLTYDTGEGTSVEEQSYKTSQPFKLRSDKPTRDGYAFAGWSEDSGSNTPTHLPQDEVTFTEREKTLYAVWYKTPQVITTNYHWDVDEHDYWAGATASVSAQVSNIQLTNTLGRMTGTLTWNVGSPAGASIVGVAVGGASYGGTNMIIHQLYINGCVSQSPNLSGSASVSFPTTEDISGSWFVAVFYTSSADLRFAYFNPAGGQDGPAPVQFSHELHIPTKIPTRDGYVFLGWCDDEADTTPDYQPGTTVTISGFMTNIVLYALWTKGSYLDVIHYNVTTGEESDVPLSNARVWVTTISNIQNNINHFYWNIPEVEEGYSLVETNTIAIIDENLGVIARGSGKEGDVIYRTWATVDVSDWKAKIFYTQGQYVITYDTLGGRPIIPTQRFAVNSPNVRLSTLIPWKQGFKFLGWDTSPGAAAVVYQAGDIINYPNSNLNLYAVYEEDGTQPPEPPDDSSPEGSGDPPEPPVYYKYRAYARPDNPQNGSVAPTVAVFMTGDTVTFTATANANNKFAYWKREDTGVAVSNNKVYQFVGEASLDGVTFVAVFTQEDQTIDTGLLYYVPTDLLMSYRNTLIWNDDGLVGCGDGK